MALVCLGCLQQPVFAAPTIPLQTRLIGMAYLQRTGWIQQSLSIMYTGSL